MTLYKIIQTGDTKGARTIYTRKQSTVDKYRALNKTNVLIKFVITEVQE